LFNLIFFLFVFLSYLNHVWIFIWIMYFKVFGYLYCLFHFYFNCVILLFTTWLKLSIYNLLKYFSCNFMILWSKFTIQFYIIYFILYQKKYFWQPYSQNKLYFLLVEREKRLLSLSINNAWATPPTHRRLSMTWIGVNNVKARHFFSISIAIDSPPSWFR
jgi:hypothetical protein